MADLKDQEAMVTVARFTSPSEGQMAKGALDAAGVESFLQGEDANSLFPGTLGERLLVSREDEADAREILESAGELVPGESLEDAGS
jgi:hypothetical protein